MKKTVYVLIGVVGIFLALASAKNGLVKFVLERGVEGATGLKLEVGEVKVGLMTTRIDIKKIRLYNPRGFKDRVMLEMPEIFVDYDLPSFFRGKIHLSTVRIDLKEFVVVKNARGELNLDALKMISGDTQKPAPAKEQKPSSLQIDTLELKVEKVIYKDYSAGGEPIVKEFNIDIDRTDKDVTDLKSLVSLIVVRALAQTSIVKLTGFAINDLEDQIVGSVFSGTGLVSGAASGAAGVGQTIEGAAQGLLQKFE